MTQSIWPWPWFTGAANQRAPLSGDVSQWLRFFSPTVNVNGRGDPELEGEIVRDVATYGAQLAPLTALVLAMAQGSAPPEDALIKLQQICQDIEATKQQYRKGVVERARRALAELKEHDGDALPAVLAEFATER
jgi:hypothetical protein